MWTAAVNKQVRLWITHFKMATVDSVNLELEKEGYMAVQGYDKRKKEGDLVYHARLKPLKMMYGEYSTVIQLILKKAGEENCL